MLQNTRALRRASAAAEARATLTSRRPTWIFGAATLGVIGAALTAGLVSAPAAGAETPDAPVASILTDAVSSAKSVDDSAITILLAEDAVSSATALNAEVASSGLDLAGAAPAVETDDLSAWVDRLGDRDELSARQTMSLSAYALTGTDEVIAETTALRGAYTAAQQRKAAEEQAAAEAAAAAEALAQANTVEGAKASARQMMSSQYGWGDGEFSCLNSLWTKESGWNYQAYNKNGGATGIPQALPGSKMASAGSDWQTNAATQIAWGLGYIDSVYGTPCSAWGHSQAMNWY